MHFFKKTKNENVGNDGLLEISGFSRYGTKWCRLSSQDGFRTTLADILILKRGHFGMFQPVNIRSKEVSGYLSNVPAVEMSTVNTRVQALISMLHARVRWDVTLAEMRWLDRHKSTRGGEVISFKACNPSSGEGGTDEGYIVCSGEGREEESRLG